MLFQSQFLMAPAYAPPIAHRSSSSQVGASSGAGSISTVTKPAGIAVGDVVVITAFLATASAPALTTSSGSAWAAATLTNTTYGRKYGLYWKVLNTTDVSNSWGLASGVDGVFSEAYSGNGATTVTLMETVNNPISQSTLSFVGYTPGYLSRGSISLLIDVDVDATDVQPTGWTRRDFTQYPASGATQKLAYADNLGSYPGGALTWTGTLGGSAFAEMGVLLDVT